MPRMTALELADRLRRGEISSEELVRDHLARIERRNGELHAFVEVTGRRALRAAQKIDRARLRGEALPRFAGIPIGIKDINFVRGTFTRAGSRAFRWLWSPVDDRVVAKLRRGGFVILGKLATSELGATPVTEPDLHPPTRNPWQLDTTPGGSSGGSAAAVAAGLLPIAHGSDGAGSIRIPSSLCGLVGFKPSRGVVVEHVGPHDPHGLAINGPIAKSVDDAAAMLEVIAGAPFLDQARKPPGRLRIRVAARSPLGATAPEIAAAVDEVAGQLADLGHDVGEAPPLDGSLEEFLPLWRIAIAAAPVLAPSRLQPVTRWLYDAGKQLDRREVHAGQDRLAARILDWFGDADAMLTPTVAVRPPAIGAWKDLAPRAAFDRYADLGAFTAPFNVTGQPAATIPVGVAPWGIPIGVQLAGRPGADALVLALARQLEVAVGWNRSAPG
jgi:amidase